MNMRYSWIILLSVLLPFCGGAQTEHDTLFVNGSTSGSFRYFKYYVDSTFEKDVTEIVAQNTAFTSWGDRVNLNVGLNPYPLWLHLNVSSTADYKIRYWLSLYTQADSVFVFQKKEGEFNCIDTLSYNEAQTERKVKTRFLATPIQVEPGEHCEFYIRIISHTRTQNFISDFTTPEANLLWERDFSWLVLFFAGCFALAAFISIVASLILRERIFLFFGMYIFSIILLLLSQELMLPVFSPRWFDLLNRIHPMAIAILGLSFHYRVVVYVTRAYRQPSRWSGAFQHINRYCLYYGLIVMIAYFVGHQYPLSRYPVYHLLYDLSIGVILLQLLITFFTIVFSATTLKRKAVFFLIAVLLIYFNPAGYYLNYSGIIRYYEITYPNYFYWVLCLELVILGYIIAERFRRTVKEKEQLVVEWERQEQQHFLREIEIQQLEKKQIARDLHDDLGATLSAIKLIVTNNYSSDKHLVKMISRANTDLRYFFSKLSSSESLKDKGLFGLLDEKKQELNRSGDIRFSFIAIGNDRQIPERLLLPAYRILCELLTNILKHSGATEAPFQLIVNDDQLQLISEDNGKGYDTREKSRGMGLNNINARVQQLKGTIHISSNSYGTTTIVIIPLKKTGHGKGI